MTINVTQEDIDKGKPDNNCECPVALAIRRTQNIPPHCHVYVEGKGAMWGFQSYALDTAGINFIDSFDNGKPVTPLTVELTEIPDNWDDEVFADSPCLTDAERNPGLR